MAFFWIGMGFFALAILFATLALSDMETFGWKAVPGMVGCLVAMFFLMSADFDRRLQESNETALASAATALTGCEAALASVATATEVRSQNDDQYADDTNLPSEQTTVRTLRQADAAACVFGALGTLVSDLKCRVSDVGLPSTVPESLNEGLRAATAVADLYTVKEVPLGGAPVGTVRFGQMLVDDPAWPVLSVTREDAWVLWPDGNTNLKVTLPSEPDFHQYCLRLADPDRAGVDDAARGSR